LAKQQQQSTDSPFEVLEKVLVNEQRDVAPRWLTRQEQLALLRAVRSGESKRDDGAERGHVFCSPPANLGQVEAEFELQAFVILIKQRFWLFLPPFCLRDALILRAFLHSLT
jgi:hypothetical protein